ncbi:MAG: CcdC protein domain-containing protein [Sphingomonadaceae bacterium]|mgnify:CR=1 FL=1
MHPKDLQTWLPLAVIVIVFALRFRNLNRPRPFRVGGLWIAPLLLSGLFAATLYAIPPGPPGWALIMLGLLVGMAAGWKRGHLMHFERDPASGRLMIRQSPAALLFILGILIVKKALSAGLGIDPAAQGSGGLSATAMLVTDGLLGFAVGMVAMMRWTLWQRARAVPPHKPARET